MPRLLAIDYGIKRTGIAVSDPMQIIASGLTTVETGKLMQFLKKYFTEEIVELVLIGMPKNLRNEATDATPFVEKFIEAFQREIPSIPIKIVDERFTSKMAFQTMIDSGMKKKDRQNKALVDEISATIIGYMSSF
jgi:putative Holliday junction resolvase